MKKSFGLSMIATAALSFAGSMPAHAIALANPVTYVENALMQAPVNTYSFGALAAASGSPCTSDSLCQGTGGGPNQTSASIGGSSLNIGSAQAQADLASGTLGAKVNTVGGTSEPSAVAGALFWDTLTFSGVTGSDSQGQINLTVNGTFTNVGYGYAGLAVGAPLSLSSPNSWTTLDSLKSSTTLTLPFTLANATPIEIGAGVLAAAYGSSNPAIADLYDPPTVSLTLPAGVTYTSASGAFLTAPVPEPTDAALLVAGLMLLGLRLRKRAI